MTEDFHSAIMEKQKKNKKTTVVLTSRQRTSKANKKEYAKNILHIFGSVIIYPDCRSMRRVTKVVFSSEEHFPEEMRVNSFFVIKDK